MLTSNLYSFLNSNWRTPFPEVIRNIWKLVKQYKKLLVYQTLKSFYYYIIIISLKCLWKWCCDTVYGKICVVSAAVACIQFHLFSFELFHSIQSYFIEYSLLLYAFSFFFFGLKNIKNPVALFFLVLLLLPFLHLILV